MILNPMFKKTTTIATLILVLGLTACSNTDKTDIEKVPDKSAQSLLVDAKNALNNGLYQKAIQILSAIDSRFPYGAISHQVQLDLIYAYYKSGDAEQGLALTDRFLRLNPEHPNRDYVHYMRALINISTQENLFQDLAGVDRSDRDPNAAREAFKDLKIILQKYPDSKYAADAKQRMIALKSRLAKYELAVARYYIKREAYVSAANRGKYIVEFFSPSPETEQALMIMIECYDKLGLKDLLINARQVLAANYPNNPLLK